MTKPLMMNYTNFEENVSEIRRDLESRFDNKIEDCYTLELELIDYIGLHGKEIPKCITIILKINNREFERINFNHLGMIDNVITYMSDDREYFDIAKKVLNYFHK